jgi:hypothetical protein
MKYLLLLCPRAKMVWKELCLDLQIQKACQVDRAGHAVLETLVCEYEASQVLGQATSSDLYEVAC